MLLAAAVVVFRLIAIVWLEGRQDLLVDSEVDSRTAGFDVRAVGLSPQSEPAAGMRSAQSLPHLPRKLKGIGLLFRASTLADVAHILP